MITDQLAVKQKLIFSRLTFREQELVHLLVQGMTNKKIAVEMGLCVGTVSNYVSVILGKLFVSNRTQIALLIHKSDIKWI